MHISHGIRKAFTSFIALACLGGTAHAGHSETAFVYITDFWQSALLSTYTVGEGAVSDLDLSIYTDAKLAANGGNVYVIEGVGADDILIVDPAETAAPVGNYSVGNATNPYNILPLNEKTAYVVRYDSPEILIVNTATGAELGTIDLSSYADEDGLPETSTSILVDTTLYVGMQFLNRTDMSWNPIRNGLVAAISTNMNAVVDTFALTVKNPLAMDITSDGSALLIGGGQHISFFDPTTQQDLIDAALAEAGVDKLNLDTGEVSRITEGADLNANVSAVCVAPGDSVAWIIAAETVWPNTAVYKIDIATGAVLDSLEEPTAASALAVSTDGDLLVGEGGMGPFGILTYDAATGDLTHGLVNTALAPAAAVFVTENDRPTWPTAEDKQVDEGANLNFVVATADADAEDVVTVAALELPDGATFNGGTATFDWTPDFFDAGDYRAVFKVSDGIDASIYAINITVLDDLLAAEVLPTPFVTELKGNAPNPFNPTTMIEYSIAEAGEVSLVVYNTAGQLVCTLVSERQSAGLHRVTWDGLDDMGRAAASGVYIARLAAGATVQTHRMTFLK